MDAPIEVNHPTQTNENLTTDVKQSEEHHEGSHPPSKNDITDNAAQSHANNTDNSAKKQVVHHEQSPQPKIEEKSNEESKTSPEDPNVKVHSSPVETTHNDVITVKHDIPAQEANRENVEEKATEIKDTSSKKEDVHHHEQPEINEDHKVEIIEMKEQSKGEPANQVHIQHVEHREVPLESQAGHNTHKVEEKQIHDGKTVGVKHSETLKEEQANNEEKIVVTVSQPLGPQACESDPLSQKAPESGTGEVPSRDQVKYGIKVEEIESDKNLAEKRPEVKRVDATATMTTKPNMSHTQTISNNPNNEIVTKIDLNSSQNDPNLQKRIIENDKKSFHDAKIGGEHNEKRGFCSKCLVF